MAVPAGVGNSCTSYHLNITVFYCDCGGCLNGLLCRWVVNSSGVDSPATTKCFYKTSSNVHRMECRELRKAFPHLKEWCAKGLWAPSCFHGSVGHGWEVVERYIQNQENPNAKTRCAGFSDCKTAILCIVRLFRMV